MSEDEPPKPSLPQNPVFKMRDFDSSKKRLFEPGPSHQRDKWAQVCVDVLKEYQAYKKQNSANGLYGSTKLRNDIMRGHDIYDGDVLVGKDSRVSEQNVNSWLNGSFPTGEKLRFLEDFIRRIMISGEIDFAGIVMRKSEESAMEALSTLYTRGTLDSDASAKIARGMAQVHVSERIKDSPIKRIAIKYFYKHAACVRVVVLYSLVDVDNVDEAKRDSLIFYDGFVLPQPRFSEKDTGRVFDGLGIERDSSSGKFLDRVEPWFGQVKLFQAEYKGTALRGSADGVFFFSFSRKRPDELRPQIIAYLPKSFTSPMSKMVEDKRLVFENADSLEPLKFLLEKKLSRKFAQLFDKYYKGYLY